MSKESRLSGNLDFQHTFIFLNVRFCFTYSYAVRPYREATLTGYNVYSG